MLTHFSLFSGIGGIDLAAEWAGFETVGQCEFADYPTKILEKHWPDVPRWRDIRSVTAEDFYNRTGLRTVDLISGGFPCQPFSVAGKQKGKRDDRYLWPEMLRVIREIKPSWVLGENVPGILSIAGKTVCEDLEREGYAVAVFNFEAAAVGAKHRRERIFFVGYSKHDGFSAIEKLRSNETSSHNWGQEEQKKAGESQGADRSVDEHGIYRSQFGSEQCAEGTLGGRSREKSFADVANTNRDGTQRDKSENWQRCGVEQGSKNVADTDNQGLQGRNSEVMRECAGEWFVGEGSTYVADTSGRRYGTSEGEICTGWYGSEYSNWWDIEPDVGRVANGISYWLDGYWRVEPDIPRVATGVKNRADRLKCLGNAVVPQQVYPILKAIAEIETR